MLGKCLVFSLFFNLLLANPSLANNNRQYYSNRPHIQDLTSRPFNEYPRYDLIQKIKLGSLEMIAQVTQMYPEHEIYFLARDAEYMFDLAQVLTQGDESNNRIHLLNISRANMRADHVQEYLAQEGISEGALRAGKKVLFVDTGFSGTIPRNLAYYFPEDLQQNLQTHLICSSNTSHPSSRVFLRELNPAVVRSEPGNMHATIVEYEHLPHFTDRSDEFTLLNGRWTPTSTSSLQNDGPVVQETAVRFMQDFLDYGQNRATLDYFKQRISFWREINLLIQTGKRDQLIMNLTALLSTESESTLQEAAIRDLIEMLNKNFNNVFNLNEFNFSLEPIATDLNSMSSSNKNLLIQKFPQWSSILENPDTELPRLRNIGDLTTIGSILDVIKDDEIHTIFAKTFANHSLNEIEYAFLESIIENTENMRIRIFLAKNYFSHPGTSQYVNLLQKLILHGNSNVLNALAVSTFSKPHTINFELLIQLMIQNGNQGTLRALATYVFYQPHTIQMRNALRMLIEKGDQDVLAELANRVFSQQHTANMGDLLKLMIPKSDQQVLSLIAEKAHTSHYSSEIIRLLIENGDFGVLKNLVRFVFSKSYANNLIDELALLYQKIGVGSHSFVLEFLTPELWTSLNLMINEPQSIIYFQTQRFQVLRTDFARGKHAIVSQVRRLHDGALFVIQRPVDNDPDHIRSFREKVTRAQKWKEMNLSSIEVIFDEESQRLLINYVEGKTLYELIEQNPHFFTEDSLERSALRDVLNRMLDTETYIGDLNAKNLIFDGERFQIIDSGSIRHYPRAEVLERIQNTTARRWNKVHRRNQQYIQSLTDFVNELPLTESNRPHKSCTQDLFFLLSS